MITVAQRAAGFWLALALLAGCDNRSSKQGVAAAPPAPKPGAAGTPAARKHGEALRPQYHLDHAQPRLPTIKLWLGAEELKTEIADELVEVATGMMFRETMAEDEGMLFVFPHTQKAAFYMKNTKVPLSAAYIDSEGVIREIHDLQPLDEGSVEAKTDQIQFVLEVPQGWFKRHHIGEGTVLRTEVGSLRETFLDWRQK